MDFLRSSVKALFVEFPLNAAALLLQTSDRDAAIKEANEEAVRKIMADILKRTQNSFSSSNIESLLDIFFNEWIIDYEENLTSATPIENRLIILLKTVGEHLLDLSHESPQVHFDNLLRWRDLTLHSSEDIITLPTVAYKDVKDNNSNRNLLWRDTLPHNSEWVNDIIKEGLNDIHSHLLASADPVSFNWLILMNYPTESVRLLGERRKITKDFDWYTEKAYDPTFPTVLTHPMHLADWIAVAAYIRYELFNRMYGLKEKDEKWDIDLKAIDKAKITSIREKTYFDIRSQFNGTTPGDDFEIIMTSNGHKWDYAINNLNTADLGDSLTSPYMIHYGERKLLYDFFTSYFKGEEQTIALAKYVWIYLLVKNKFRREVISTNTLSGFKNFQEYYGYRNIFFNKRNKPVDSIVSGDDLRDMASKCDDLSIRYAIQTSIGKNVHGLETRIGVNALRKVRECDYNKSIFGNIDLWKKTECDISVVIHFMKDETSQKEPLITQFGKYEKDKQKIIQEIQNETTDKENLQFVGIDSCSSELAARPYIFSRIYKEIASEGMRNHTFHVGEDFHDILDGLRSIDEAWMHLYIDSVKLRLGHAIALGIDIRNYYSKRHNYAILPMQILLDNLVWLKFTGDKFELSFTQDLKDWIDSNFNVLTEKIGYKTDDTPISMKDYWESIKLRGVSQEEFKEKQFPSFIDQPISQKSEDYWKMFTMDEEINKIGNKTIEIKIPEALIPIICNLQKELRKFFENKDICIECNPTSNLIIGPFDKYCEHPIFKMKDPKEIDGKLTVTISTDNKGIMATSIENEYSLIAAAMCKGNEYYDSCKYNKDTIVKYLNEIKSNGKINRFRIS